MNCKKQIAAGTAIVALWTGVVSADVLFDNIGKLPDASGVANLTEWQAQQVTTDANSYNLLDVALLLAMTTPGTASLELYSDNTGAPGISLHTLTSPGSYSETAAATTFTSTGYTLTSNSTYWVVLKAADSGVFDWNYTTDDTGAGVGFSTIWAYTDNSGSTWETDVTAPYQMTVNVEVIPEPSCAMLLTLGFSLVYFRRRFSNR